MPKEVPEGWIAVVSQRQMTFARCTPSLPTLPFSPTRPRPRTRKQLTCFAVSFQYSKNAGCYLFRNLATGIKQPYRPAVD